LATVAGANAAASFRAGSITGDALLPADAQSKRHFLLMGFKSSLDAPVGAPLGASSPCCLLRWPWQLPWAWCCRIMRMSLN